MNKEISLHQLASGQFSIGRTASEEEKEALKNNSMNPSQIFEAMDALNEEVEEVTQSQEVKYLEPQIANYAKAISRTIKK